MNLFQRTSSFDQDYAQGAREERPQRDVRLDVTGEHNQSRVARSSNIPGERTDSPSRSDLERWYRVLDEMMSVGSHQSSAELQDTLADVRDEIYGFLY